MTESRAKLCEKSRAHRGRTRCAACSRAETRCRWPEARHVVFVYERQPVSLERTAEVDGDDTVGFIVRDGVHLDGQCAVAAVDLEGETDFNVVELVRFHDQNLF